MWGGSAVTAAMVVAEFIEMGISTVMKAAMSRGMSQFVYMFYSNALALFILIPSSFIYYRNRPLPKITGSIICRILFQAILSCGLQITMNTGVKYGSPTLYAAMTDLTPAFTFLIAVICRMEKLELRLQSSQAKSIGTIVSVGGALFVTLYKGQPIALSLGLETTSSLHGPLLGIISSNWILGGILCAASALILALLLVVQTWILEDYPAELMVTCITCSFVTVLSAIVALIVDNNLNAWILKPDVGLIAIVCSAILGVTIRSVIYAWACRKEGPLFTAMFKPLGMIIAIILGVSFLGDSLYFGSVIGGIIISIGFYTVIWGKAQEDKMSEDETNVNYDSSFSPKVPLLQNKNEDNV
ncbi:WAT1-related protein At3g28050-like [Mercurialis annua]|uniref:WAT1-related protein At3g28050-like n=1 Tax=Mercurialis annua TaxID=3986 RepID=UPI0021603F44|nr:WAT1-related protein At3g28050-like [Mercurialis annua]